jgi:hypothetical protein
VLCTSAAIQPSLLQALEFLRMTDLMMVQKMGSRLAPPAKALIKSTLPRLADWHGPLLMCTSRRVTRHHWTSSPPNMAASTTGYITGTPWRRQLHGPAEGG